MGLRVGRATAQMADSIPLATRRDWIHKPCSEPEAEVLNGCRTLNNTPLRLTGGWKTEHRIEDAGAGKAIKRPFWSSVIHWRASMGRSVLYAYVDGSDNEEFATELCAQAVEFIASHQWVSRPPWVVNQRHAPDSSSGTDDLADWDLGFNLELPDGEPGRWFRDIEALLRWLGRCHATLGPEFVVGIANAETGVSDDLVHVASADPDIDLLRRLLGTDVACRLVLECETRSRIQGRAWGTLRLKDGSRPLLVLDDYPVDDLAEELSAWLATVSDESPSCFVFAADQPRLAGSLRIEPRPVNWQFTSRWETARHEPVPLEEIRRVVRAFVNEVKADPDYDDLAVQEEWCAAIRSEVLAYLARERVRHGGVGEWPAWHVAPIVSVWAIESPSRPGHVGWWVICGDLPTDYVSAANIKNPRDAVRVIAERWLAYVEGVRTGKPPEDYSIGVGTQSKDLVPLLESRAKMLSKWTEDDFVWEGLDANR